MSTKLRTIKGVDPQNYNRNAELSLMTFYGGDKHGLCVQLNATKYDPLAIAIIDLDLKGVEELRDQLDAILADQHHKFRA